MNKKITMITIGNVGNKAEGEKKVAKLQEITKNNFENFTYGVCPIGGSFDIVVSSDYQYEDEKEMLQSFVFLLANQI